MRRMVVAGLAMTSCTAATYQDQAERAAAVRRDDNQFSQRIRRPEESGRRICAVDRLAESRLPRTTCRTAREWRERQFHGMRKE